MTVKGIQSVAMLNMGGGLAVEFGWRLRMAATVPGAAGAVNRSGAWQDCGCGVRTGVAQNAAMQ